MPGFLSVLNNVAAPLANTVAAQNQAQIAENDKKRQQAIQDVLMKRQATIDDQNAQLNKARIGNYDSQSATRAEGDWGKPFPADVGDGPSMFVYNRKTEQLKRADLPGSTDSTTGTVAGTVAGAMTPPPDGQDMETGAGTPTPPSTPNSRGVRTSIGSTAISNGAPGAATGDIDLRDGAPPATPSIASAAPTPPQVPPVPQGTQDPTPSRVLRPVPPKPSPTANDRTPVNFKIVGVGGKGRDVAGSIDKQGRRYDETGAPIPPGMRVAPYAPPQAPASNVFLPSVDSTGRTVYSVGSSKGAPNIRSTDVEKPGPNGTSTGSQTSITDMVERLAEIKEHANNLAAGKGTVTRAMQTREGLEYGIANSSAGGHGVPLKDALTAGGMDALGLGGGPGDKDYEDYAALMNSTRALGDDVTKVFKGRQNEDAVRREIALAQLAPGDFKNPKVVAQKLQRLQNVIDLAKATMPKAKGDQQGAPKGAPKTGEQAGGQAVAKDYGIFGKPPGGE